MSKFKLFLPWIICAALFGILGILSNLNNIPQVLGKLFALCAGGVLGALLFDSLLGYFRPSGWLAEPWDWNMAFKPGETNQKIVPGYELVFVAACFCKALCIIGGAYVVGLGN